MFTDQRILRIAAKLTHVVLMSKRNQNLNFSLLTLY